MASTISRSFNSNASRSSKERKNPGSGHSLPSQTAPSPKPTTEPTLLESPVSRGAGHRKQKENIYQLGIVKVLLIRPVIVSSVPNSSSPCSTNTSTLRPLVNSLSSNKVLTSTSLSQAQFVGFWIIDTLFVGLEVRKVLRRLKSCTLKFCAKIKADVVVFVNPVLTSVFVVFGCTGFEKM